MNNNTSTQTKQATKYSRQEWADFKRKRELQLKLRDSELYYQLRYQLDHPTNRLLSKLFYLARTKGTTRPKASRRTLEKLTWFDHKVNTKLCETLEELNIVANPGIRNDQGKLVRSSVYELRIPKPDEINDWRSNHSEEDRLFPSERCLTQDLDYDQEDVRCDIFPPIVLSIYSTNIKKETLLRLLGEKCHLVYAGLGAHALEIWKACFGGLDSKKSLKQLVHLTKLSERQVKRVLASLRRYGIIQTVGKYYLGLPFEPEGLIRLITDTKLLERIERLNQRVEAERQKYNEPKQLLEIYANEYRKQKQKHHHQDTLPSSPRYRRPIKLSANETTDLAVGAMDASFQATRTVNQGWQGQAATDTSSTRCTSYPEPVPEIDCAACQYGIGSHTCEEDYYIKQWKQRRNERHRNYDY